MDNIIPRLYRSYGKHINTFRSFPMELDGLKPVERRVLLSLYQVAKEFTKSVRVSGHCLSHYHPHGDCYNTIVFLVRQGLAEGQGNWGSYVGIEHEPAGAARYTEVRLAPFMKEFAFSFLDEVPWERIDLDEEPVYLPVMLPICLLGVEYTTGIGFGYKTCIPSYEISDLVDRLLFLLGKEKTEPIIKPVTDCEILSPHDDLRRLLQKGTASIKMKGRMEINEDNRTIILKSWPYSTQWSRIISKLKGEIDRNELIYSDYSSTETRIEFKVKKKGSDVFSNIIKKLEDAITDNVSFNIITVDLEGNIKNTSVDYLLMNTYKMYSGCLLSFLHKKVKKLQSLKDELLKLESLRPLITRYMIDASKKNGTDLDNIITEMEKKVEGARLLLSKYNINSLLRIDDNIAEISNEIDTVNNQIKNYESIIIEKYKYIRNL